MIWRTECSQLFVFEKIMAQRMLALKGIRRNMSIERGEREERREEREERREKRREEKRMIIG